MTSKTYQMTVRISSAIGFFGPGGARDTYSAVLPARLDVTENKCTLSFREERDGGVIYTTMTYEPGGSRVHMRGRGNAKSDILFDCGEEHHSIYKVGEYKFDLTVRTGEVTATLTEQGGEISLVYERQIGGHIDLVSYQLIGTPTEERA